MQTVRRKSAYVDEVLHIVSKYGHATNQQIATQLRTRYPSVSDTTVHRVTQRLVDDRVIGYAPMTHEGWLRFDVNTTPHDHFVCLRCGRLRDIVIADTVRNEIEQALDDCQIAGSMTIHGNCQKCVNNK